MYLILTIFTSLILYKRNGLGGLKYNRNPSSSMYLILFHFFFFFTAGSFWTNPQFKIHIDEPDDDDEDGNGSIIVGVMQKDRRKARNTGGDNHTIGYAVYGVRI